MLFTNFYLIARNPLPRNL